MTPHLNIGYVHKPAELQSDALEFRAGFDNKIYADLTFALDILGQIDLNSAEAIHLAPGSVTIYDQAPPGLLFQSGPVPRVVNLSNIPDSNGDNLYSASMGFRFAPSDRVMLFGNILVPLNKAGLRAAIVPTLGGSVSF
jgi:hypothetical protein